MPCRVFLEQCIRGRQGQHWQFYLDLCYCLYINMLVAVDSRLLENLLQIASFNDQDRHFDKLVSVS